MIRVRITRSTVGDGGRVLAVGEELRLPDSEARQLVGLGKAELLFDLPDGVGAAPVPQHADPVPTHAPLHTPARPRGKR